MSLTVEEATQINKVVKNWAGNSARRMRVSSGSALRGRIKVRNTMRDGLLDAAGFQFPRHGVFYEMGVFGRLSRKEAISQGKLNPHPWFNPTIEKDVPKLMTKILDNYEDFTVNALNLKIKNI